MSCYGCVCNHCLYNAELEPWYFTPGEVQDVEEICYVCDECKHYDGDPRKRIRWRPVCNRYKMPRKYNLQIQNAAEREAQRRRAALQIVKGRR